MFTLIGKTNFVWHVGQHSKWSTSTTLIALHIAPFEPVFPSVLVQYLSFCDNCEASECGGFNETCFFPKEQCVDWMN